MESSRKLLEILLLFDRDRPELTVQQMATLAGIPISSTYRYVATLRDAGLLESNQQGAYRVGARIIPVAQAASEAFGSLVDVARPIMHRIQAEFGETVLVVRRVGEAVYCLDRVESERAVRLSFDPGQPMRLHEGSSARVLLAAMPGADRDAYLERVAAEGVQLSHRLDPHELDLVRDQGWTESFEEVDAGIWGTAATIERSGEVIAALGCAGPLFRLDGPRREAIIEAIRQGAHQISEELRGAPQPPGPGVRAG